MPVPNLVYIYRMVHWRNVDYILRNGMCCRDHPNADPHYVNIGHSQLIQDRHDQEINFQGAGHLGEYVPFYFAGHSPMLLQIRNGTGTVQQRPQDDIVFVVSTYEIIENAGLEFVFTDMHARRVLATFYNNRIGLNQLRWDYIESKIWKNTNEHLNRQDYKQAEFLVRNNVPVNCIHALVTFSDTRANYCMGLVNNLVLNIDVVVDTQRNLYY